MDYAEALVYARRVAYRMSKDPEMGSIAGRCAMKAVQTFDPTRGVPEKRWIARIVRLTVHYYWRRQARRRDVQKSDVWWETVYVMDDPPEPEIDTWTWNLLHRYHVEKWAVGAMCDHYSVDRRTLRRLVREAEGRLLRAVSDA